MFDYEEDESIEIPPETNCHAVAVTLKKYFQELPNSLMTNSLFDNFMSIASMTNKTFSCLLWPF